MRNIVENFNVNNSFWEYNPSFKIASPFKELFNSDKSRGKKNSSNIMWAIALCYHPSSDLYNLPDKEVRVFDMVKDKSFKLKDYTEYIKEFLDTCLSEAQKSLIAWDNRMKSRDGFLANQEYSFGYEVRDEEGSLIKVHKSNVKELDEMMSRTSRIYQEYFKIKKELNEEDQIKKGRGGKNLSLSDAGEI
jgi:hypothetical protein